METSELSGVLPVLAVPFSDDGRLDLEGFDAVCDLVIGSGAEGALLFGLASEFYKLSDSERAELRRRFLAAAQAAQGFAAIVSVTEHATWLAVQHAVRAVSEGADAINLLPPYFLGPSAAELLAHLEAVLAAVNVPVIVQYAPAQTGTSLRAEALREVATRHSNLATVKVESQPPGRMVTELQKGEPRLSAIVGYAGLQLPDAVRRGAVGVQPGCSFPELYVRLWQHHLANDVAAFEALHARMLPYLSSWMQQVEFIIQIEKSILKRRGIIRSDHCRRPGWELDQEESRAIDRFLDDFASVLH